MTEPRNERPLGELFGTLATQLGQLIHQEVELARTEMTANVSKIGRNSALIGAGGAVLYLAAFALVIALIALLAQLGLPVWISAVVVGVVLGAIGVALVQQGRSQLRAASLAPTRTIETLKDDADWAKEQTR